MRSVFFYSYLLNALLISASGVFGQSSGPIADLSLQPPLIITDPLPRYDYDKLDFGMNMGLERTNNARIWSLWTAGGDNADAFMVLIASNDNGFTWSKPLLVIDAPDASPHQKRSVQNGTLWKDPAGRLWVFFDQSMNDFDGRAGIWYIICNNPDAEKPVWSKPVRIWHGTGKSKPIVLKNGKWMLPVSLLNRDIIDKKPGDYLDAYHELDSLRMAHVFVSTDQGLTWKRSGGIRFPHATYDEQHVIERKDGTLWMTARTKSGIYQSVSADEGATWTSPVKYMEHISSRHFIRRLASGNLLLVKHGQLTERTSTRSKLMAFLSDDEGLTWKGGLMLDERRGVSYPDGFQSPDGTIYISYDRNRETDGEILLVRFSEMDVLDGDVSGKKTPERTILSRPLGLDKLPAPSTQADSLTSQAALYNGLGLPGASPLANVNSASAVPTSAPNLNVNQGFAQTLIGITNTNAALQAPVLNTDPLPEYGYDRLDYGMNIGIERTNNGRIWACWVGGGDNEDAFFVLNYSDDNGEQWTQPKLVIDPHDPHAVDKRRSLVGCLWKSPNSDLWLFFDQGLTYFDGRSGVWYTVCRNPDADRPEWTTPARIWHGATLNKPVVLKNKTWLLPVSLWDRGKIKNDRYKMAYPELDSLRMAHVFKSVDEGKTWQRTGGVKFPNPQFDEHHIIELKDGRLWMTARTSKGIWQSFSNDGGITWSAPSKYMNHIGSRHFIRRLASGRLLMVRHGAPDETTRFRSKLMAWLSEDEGSTWKGGLMIDERRGVSYPDGFQAPDGSIYISYDRNRDTDGKILMARFTEADILAGRFVKKKSKSKILISAPTGLDKQPYPSGQIDKAN